jgi:hypothetical protein
MKNVSRRNFLQLAAMSVGALSTGSKAIGEVKGGISVCLVADPGDAVVSSKPVAWAMGELSAALARHGIGVKRANSLDLADAAEFYLVVSASNTQTASRMVHQAGTTVSQKSESNAFIPFRHKGRPALLATGNDARGLMYALLELTDRVEHADANPLQTLKLPRPISEEPFTEVRSIGRLFVSDVNDKPWFYDRSFWPEYFAMLAKNRFNRFNLSFGIGYDTLVQVSDSSFLFVYPFFVQLMNYEVRAVGMKDDELGHNLETLLYISRQAVEHGIEFQLGIWTHGYQWADTPKSNYTIEGLTPENHAAYSRDALAALLGVCRDISGVTIRTHGESGVKEGNFDFWKTVLSGVPQSGRKVEIDLHTKGLNQVILDHALATGMPVKLSPKYWAEHMGLPYQQAAIRDLEMPGESKAQSFYSLSTGSRSFTRYGYADFLREDRPYKVIYRIWPGTHRFLLWGDPVSNAAHAKAFQFCGSNGVELYEPLSFKGRRGSGLSGSRCGYADESLNPQRDWEKYLYTYRTWGRLLYNPNADPDTWRRQLRKQFQQGAEPVEASLGAATSIVPLITTAHLPSAANDTYGPEFYTNQSLVDEKKYSPYHDTPAPKVFGNVSPIDPQIFARINDFAECLLKGERNGRYSPIEVAQWLEDLADRAANQLAEAAKRTNVSTPAFRRVAGDIKIEVGLAKFFAAKFRSGVLYSIYQQTGDKQALEESLKAYRRARDVWAQFAEEASHIYVPDITYGPRADERGCWKDRLPAIDDDLATMEQMLKDATASAPQSATAQAAIKEALGRPARREISCTHVQPPAFVKGRALALEIGTKLSVSATLYYRHVNQSEHYQSVEMTPQGEVYRAAVPGDYTDSNYPLQYYFEFRQGRDKAWLYPGLNADLINQPYFVVRGKTT